MLIKLCCSSANNPNEGRITEPKYMYPINIIKGKTESNFLHVCITKWLHDMTHVIWDKSAILHLLKSTNYMYIACFRLVIEKFTCTDLWHVKKMDCLHVHTYSHSPWINSEPNYRNNAIIQHLYDRKKIIPVLYREGGLGTSNMLLFYMVTLSKFCDANAENLINTLTFNQRSNESGDL